MPNESVIVNDDVSVENLSSTTGRFGVVGTVIVEKLVGRYAESVADLRACKAFGERVTARIVSLGAAFSSCTVPAAGKPTFTFGDDEIGIGVAIHGEPGRGRAKFETADAIADELLTAIAEDLKPAPDARPLLFVSGRGGTPLSELYLLYHAARGWIDGRRLGVALARRWARRRRRWKWRACRSPSRWMMR